jgi:transposase
MSHREAARQFGLARETVRKMLRYSVPPGYQRQRKQRHTAKRICERLKAEHGYTGGYTIIKDYVRLKKLSQREMFVPLEHPPGDAQADFGEAQAVIGGEELKAHYLVVDLPQSDDCFVMAFAAETTEAFLEGHNHAFRYFGGVPRTMLYDNTKLAVARILGDGTRQKTRAFSELQSHYLFAEKFGRPAKGAGAALPELGRVQRASAGAMPEAARAHAARVPADHRRTFQTGSGGIVAAARGAGAAASART